MQGKLLEDIVNSLIKNLKVVTFDEVGVIAVNGYRYFYNSINSEIVQFSSISPSDKSLVLSLGKEVGQILRLNLGQFCVSHRETLQRDVYRECDSSDWLRRNQVVPVEDCKRGLIYFYSITSNKVVPFEIRRFKKLMDLDDYQMAKVTIKCGLVHREDRDLGIDTSERTINCLDASPWVF